MAPVHAAGQLQGCALKHLDERALFFFRSKTKSCLCIFGKSSLARQILPGKTGAPETAAGGQLSSAGKTHLEDLSQALPRKMGISS